MWRSKLSPEARWTLCCIGGVMAISAVFSWVNWKVDLYGLFGKGSRIVYSDERQGKYLLSRRYVPGNFDALLVGTSITDNWDTSKIDSLRMYNGSISGGNISEAKIVADNVLTRTKLKAIVFCVYPYLTQTHGRKAGGMDEREFWGAFGSLQLLRDYAEAVRIERRGKPRAFDEFGMNHLEFSESRRIWWEKGGISPPNEDVTIDPVAYAEYGELVQKARSAGTEIFRVVPPINYQRWSQNRDAFTKYFVRMNDLFHADETLVDFNRPEFDPLRKERETFNDGAHLSQKGVSYVMNILNQTIRLRTVQELNAKSLN